MGQRRLITLKKRSLGFAKKGVLCLSSLSIVVLVGTLLKAQDSPNYDPPEQTPYYNPLSQIRQLGGTVFVDADLEPTGALREHKFIEFVRISTPTSPAQNFRVWYSSFTDELCVIDSSGSTGCISTTTVSNMLQTTQSGTVIQNNTTSLNFLGPPFKLTAIGGTTTQVALDGSSVTLRGTAWATSVDASTAAIGTSTGAINARIGEILIASFTAANIQTGTFTITNPTNYSEYIVYIDSISPTVNAVNLTTQISISGAYVTTGYSDQTFRWTTAASGTGGQAAQASWIPSSNSETLGTAASNNAEFEIHYNGVNSNNAFRHAHWLAEGQWASGTYVAFMGAGTTGTGNGAIDGIRFSMSNGNINTGIFFLYGVVNHF